LFIAHPSFGEPGRAVALAQVAAFHGHAVEPVGQARELGAVELDDRHQLDAGGLQPLLVLGKAPAAVDRGVAELLELLTR
jgi:hypothetical protein